MQNADLQHSISGLDVGFAAVSPTQKIRRDQVGFDSFREATHLNGITLCRIQYCAAIIYLASAVPIERTAARLAAYE